MKHLITLVFVLSSLNSFAKGRSGDVSDKCAGTEKLIGKAVATELNEYLVHGIRSGYDNGEEPLKKSEVELASVVQNENHIFIYHVGLTPSHPEFMTHIPIVSLKFKSESSSKAGIVCKWRLYTMGIIETRDVNADRRVDSMELSGMTLKIPALK